MIELNLQQGTPEWAAARAKCHTASEAPAMMGVSQYKKRSALIAEKATGIIQEVDSATQARFDMGHMTEALARPLAEGIVGEELYPIVATDDSGKYLASSDGATMLVNIGFEHKLWNENLAAEVAQGNVPESHRWQLDHQFLVFGFEKIIFVVSDGTPEKMVHCWYYPQPERIRALIEGWEQFDKDVAAYVPSEITDMPKAESATNLPALFVHAKGEITTHNMEEFGKALTAKLAETRAIVLVTDQDFSNAKSAAAKFRETAKDIALAKKQMLEQTETIGEAARKMDAWAEDLNATALQLEKDVKREDLAKKEVMVLTAKGKYTDHVAALEAETKPIRLVLVAPIFAEAIKGKSKYSNMQDSVDTMLAGAIIAADQSAKDVREKLAWCKEHAAGHSALFPDLQQIITKPMEDFALTITSRIDKAKAEDAARLEAERERIRAEEQAKAQREAAEKAEAEKREADAKAAAEKAEQDRINAEEIRKLDEDRRAAQAQAAADALAALPKFESANHIEKPLAMVDHPAPATVKESLSVAPTLKLGEINARLGYSVSAEFLASLGFVATTDRTAKLYREADFPTICRKIADHTLALDFRKAA